MGLVQPDAPGRFGVSGLYALLLRRAEEKVERNLEMAERFHYHPVFEAKFLRQAIEAEAELKRVINGENIL